MSFLLECIYAVNAVSHILSGKAIASAVRGHFLVSRVLHALVVSHIFHTPLPHLMENEAGGPGGTTLQTIDEAAGLDDTTS